MKKVLVLLADGFEEIEALSVVDVLRRANVDCKMCSIDEEYVRGTLAEVRAHFEEQTPKGEFVIVVAGKE